MKKWPQVSVLMVTLNSHRTFEKCLAYIKKQNYPGISEVLIVDGGSTDDSLLIAKKSGLPVRIIKGGYKNNQEARRAIAVENAKNEICAMIDTDNYIEDPNWMKKMVEPLDRKDIIASQTLRYSAPKNTTIFNRYFGLLGATDPVAYYLGKDDRLSHAFDKWNLLGKIVDENKKYYVIDFDPANYPTLGCNGIVFKRSILLKSKWGNDENYIHTDVFVDIAKLGFTRFAIVKNEIFHNTADNIFSFFKKRRDYMLIHYGKLGKRRRYTFFNRKRAQDVLMLIVFILLSITLLVPIVESIRGYIKKRDVAWFLHPIVCLGILFVYSEATINLILKRK